MFQVLPLLIAATASFNTTFPSFPEWVQMYGKSYQPTESDYRMTIYYENLDRIYNHNLGNHTWTMGVNQFTDMTSEEFAGLYLNRGLLSSRHSRKSLRSHMADLKNTTALPTSVDWEAKGAVTPIKNQEQCGSCWAFSTTGSVEGAWFIANGSLVSLSEQQLVDCSVPQGNQGCNGGLMDDAFQYIIDNKGITTETAYPYTATGPNACDSKGKPVAATITNFKDVPANSETALMTAIVQQPVSVAVEADQSVFQFYSGGVMTSACGTQLDHGVLAVGYGTDAANGGDYYKVKNSWGNTWGEKGYIRLGRGAKFNPSGQCGIQMMASFPIV